MTGLARGSEVGRYDAALVTGALPDWVAGAEVYAAGIACRLDSAGYGYDDNPCVCCAGYVVARYCPLGVNADCTPSESDAEVNAGGMSATVPFSAAVARLLTSWAVPGAPGIKA